MPAAKNVIGERFGRLVVIGDADSVRSPNGTSVRRVECKCDCGAVGVFRLPLLRNGKTRSCGCLSREVKSARMTKHGGSGSAEYRIWLGMLRRCSDLSNENYGGRGIRVCDRWRESFAAFLADMGSRPSDEHSIDRYPNNDGNYEPGNCRWATAKEQMRNTRVNQMVAYGDEELCVTEWAERFGLPAPMLASRLNAGWEFDVAVSTPSNAGDCGFYLTPIKKRDANWYREYERREASR